MNWQLQRYFNSEEIVDLVLKIAPLQVVMIGAFPPPVHGMAVINSAVCDRLKNTGASIWKRNIAGSTINGHLIERLQRIPKIFHALIKLAVKKNFSKTNFYLSVSGGFGQIYEILFVWIARLKGMNIYLHHHSFAYLQSHRFVTKLLITSCGSSCAHIVLSPKMGKRLRYRYKAKKILPISNAIFLSNGKTKKEIKDINLQTIGFISNISAEKGVFDFLDLIEAVEAANIPLRAKLAGPFQSLRVKDAVLKRLVQMNNTDYLGPVYGKDKNEFFSSIDLLVFPTRYVNEAEPLVVLEAMRFGIPTIAYGRGCIPEIVCNNNGKVIDTEKDFTSKALRQIKTWTDHPEVFIKASLASVRCFDQIVSRSLRNWQELLMGLQKKEIVRI